MFEILKKTKLSDKTFEMIVKGTDPTELVSPDVKREAIKEAKAAGIPDPAVHNVSMLGIYLDGMEDLFSSNKAITSDEWTKLMMNMKAGNKVTYAAKVVVIGGL